MRRQQRISEEKMSFVPGSVEAHPKYGKSPSHLFANGVVATIYLFYQSLTEEFSLKATR
jgi:hypothetical protein